MSLLLLFGDGFQAATNGGYRSYVGMWLGGLSGTVVGGTSVAVFATYYNEQGGDLMLLRQSTASQTISLGRFVDSTDGDTSETGLTIANTDIKLSKNGAALVSKNSLGATHDADGVYYCTLDATDTDTVGELYIKVKVAGALSRECRFRVLEEAVYDSLFAASAAGYQVPIWASASSTVDLANTTISTAQAVASVSGAVGSVTGNVGGNVVGSVGSVTGAVGSVTGNVGGNVAGSVGSVVAGVTVTTNNDKTGYSLTATTGLGNQTADITGSISGSVGSVTGAVGSVTGNVGGNVVGSVGSVTAAVTVGTINANVVNASALASDAVTEIQSGLATSASLTTVESKVDVIDGIVDSIIIDTAEIGVAGAGLTDIGGFSTAAKAEINAEVVDTLTTDTYAEPAAVPSATASLKDKLGYLALWARNKSTQTATERKIYADDGSTVVGTETVSDDGTTYTKGEAS